MTSPILGFQRCSDNTVRALRINGDDLVSSRNVWDLSTAVALVDSFRREFPKGRVLVESLVDNRETEPLTRGDQLVALFQ